jgi:hypothetical protein
MRKLNYQIKELMKAIKQAKTRNILDFIIKKIFYSRMNEMFNELADQFALGFADYYLVIFEGLEIMKLLSRNL